MMSSLLFILLLPLTIIGYNVTIQSAMSANLKKLEINPETGIMKGAEPVYLKGNNSKAVLLIHGFIGTPTDYGRLPKLLNEEGYTVSVPLLPGHGRNPKEFSKTTADELAHFVDEEFVRLKQNHDEVIVVGFSMGGALATLLASQHDIKQLVLLAPYYEIAHQWYYLLPTEVYSKILTPVIPYFYRPKMFKQINKRDELDQMVDYDFVSAKGSQAIMELGKRAKEKVGNISAETLIIHSEKDKATDYAQSLELSKQIPNLKRFVTLKNTNHMVLWDYDVKLVENEILSFIKNEVRV